MYADVGRILPLNLGVCSVCRAPASNIVLTGQLWTRTCEDCTPGVATMAQLDRVVNG